MKKTKLKSKYCNELLANGIKPYSVIRHSYTNHRLSGEVDMNEDVNNNICPTLDTRCDCLAVVVEVESYGNKSKKE